MRNKPCHFRPLIFWSFLLLRHNLAYPGLVENTGSRERGVPFYIEWLEGPSNKVRFKQRPEEVGLADI